MFQVALIFEYASFVACGLWLVACDLRLATCDLWIECLLLCYSTTQFGGVNFSFHNAASSLFTLQDHVPNALRS